jgi:hypothetical protein
MEFDMPEISRFYGIIIAMFYDEHNPPHFHVRYGGYKVSVNIHTLSILEGKLPPRALGLVIEWASLHQDELLQNWNLAKERQTPNKIEPLN